MNTRHVLLFLAPLCFAMGCLGSPDAPAAGTASVPGAEPKAEANLAPSVAPEPHAPGAGNVLLPVAKPWTDRSSKKPWPELIVGKWLRAKPETFGRKVWEFTKDGKFNTCYSYPAASNGNFPAGVERSTGDYRVNGNILFPTSTDDDTLRITESTTFIESLTENELRLSTVKRVRRSLQSAKDETKVRKITLEQALAEVLIEERTPGSVYVRLMDRGK